MGLVSLVTENLDRADRFITDTLGELEGASPDIKTAVLAFCHRAVQRLACGDAALHPPEHAAAPKVWA
jgi:hypothetical protein